MKISTLLDIPALADYFTRIGAEARSLRTAVVYERHGRYRADREIISISESGEIKAPDALIPTELEKKDIARQCAGVEWPKVQLLKRLGVLPEEIDNADPSDVFEFRDVNGDYLMLQLRKMINGEKHYIPFTFYDDGVWRKMEPEGKLPLFGLDQLKTNSMVFIHEGAKAAKRMRWIVERETPAARAAYDAHPWADELSAGAHLGWIGGALAPHRSDWSALTRAGVKRAYVVADNDRAGLGAVAAIAFNLRIPTFLVQFTSEWPACFDLGDDFPKDMFSEIEGNRYYNGPAFRACLHPATWATDAIPNPKGKPTIALRAHFKDMWSYIEEADTFVCVEAPSIVRDSVRLDRMLAAYSHTMKTSELILKANKGRTTKLCYRPDINKNLIVTDATTSAVNLHISTFVKSSSGSIAPFLDFMSYLFPNLNERIEVMKWCATLIARIDIKMEYGLLLVSESQGVGKSTLGDQILKPLVGKHNVSQPSETQIVQSEFNGWIAKKRLCIIHEIYSGHSWKAYNRLKSVITEKEIEVNEKFEKTYLVENWIHIFACSNSMRALRMEEDDRRWFYPEVNEDKWSADRFTRFHAWLKSGGLGIIKHWAENFGNYISRGENAPMSERKKQLIYESKTEAQRESGDLAMAMNNFNDPIAFIMKDVVAWVRKSTQGIIYDSDLSIRKIMKENGVFCLDDRILINNRTQYIIVNRKALEYFQQKYEVRIVKGQISFVLNEDQRREIFIDVRKMVRTPNEVLGAVM